MSKSTNQSQTKQKRRSARREEERRREEQQRQHAARRRRITIGVCVIAAALVVGAAIFFFARQAPGQAATGSASATQAQSVSDASTNPAYASLAGIPCQSSEQLTYHIHAHLSIYIDGKAVQVPQDVGIASDGSCFYWLHTHDTSGVIHIEAPGPHTFTLGTFLQLWSERFAQLGYPLQLDQTTGWQAYVDGKPYTGDFHSIPLKAHALITLAYNSPGIEPDTTYAWQGL